tara:strand:- start:1959 stop:2696 length:738 start_codon:yes stop_codon:yes gene_type:complete
MESLNVEGVSNEDYQLFGLDPNTCTVKDAKRAYYNMALLVHPDRNQCVDKEEGRIEMCNVATKYNSIMLDIERRNNNSKIEECKSQKEIEGAYKEIMKELSMPSFSDIFHQTRNIKDLEENNDIFNQKWKKEVNDKDYLLDSAGYNLIKSEINDKDYNAQPDLIGFIPSLTINNQIVLKDSYQFSSKDMCDYNEAYGFPTLLHERIDENVFTHYNQMGNIDIDKRFDEILKQRNDEKEITEKNMK